MQINVVQGYNYQNAGLSKNNKQSFGHLKLGETLPMQTIADTLSYSVNSMETNNFIKLFRELHSVEINLNDLLSVDDFLKVFKDKYFDDLIKPFHQKYKKILFKNEEITNCYNGVREKFFEAIEEDEAKDYTVELEKKPHTKTLDLIYTGLRIKNPDKLKHVEDIKLSKEEIIQPLNWAEKTAGFCFAREAIRLPKDENVLLEFIKSTLLDDLVVATRTLLEPLHIQRVNAGKEKIAKELKQKADNETAQIAKWQKEFRV